MPCPAAIANRRDITADAARSFVEDHLASIAEPLAKSLENSGIVYLQLAAEALLKRVGPVRYVALSANSLLPLYDDKLSCCELADDEQHPHLQDTDRSQASGQQEKLSDDQAPDADHQDAVAPILVVDQQ